jgi:hypothetical protein
MKQLVVAALSCITLPGGALAAAPGDMTGAWSFDAALSRNVGPMAQASVTSSISLSGERLTVTDVSRFRGKDYRQRTIYDLSGAPVVNTSQMGGACTTVSHWTRDHLRTDWACPGALRGTTSDRVEERYLVHGSAVMIVKSQRPGAAAITMVFLRQ